MHHDNKPPVSASSVAVAPAVTAMPAAAPMMDANQAAAWIHAFTQAQQTTAQAHAAWQQTMAEAHIAFLRTSDQAMAGLQAMLTGQAVTATTAAAPVPRVAATCASPVVAAPPSVPVVAAAPAPAPIAPASAPIAPVSAPIAPAPAPIAPVSAPIAPVSAPIAAPAQAPEPVATPAVAAPSSAVDVKIALLTVVADKTGYPAEMLDLTMELEADLGIDSIKRVEILAALADSLPALPEIDASEAGELSTLGAILERLGGVANSTSGDARDANGAPNNGSNGEAAMAASVDIGAALLSVVADKTGYPADMLELSMELEADLGIDSIKRVEILSAMTDQVPGLLDVDATDMAELRTLGSILDSLNATRGNGETGDNTKADTSSRHADSADKSATASGIRATA